MKDVAQPELHMFTGIRVVDFTQVLAGPTATRLLAELGADIIKVELAPAGDSSRALPYLRNGRSGYFIQQNRGKRSICIDAKTPGGKEVLRRLVRSADVLVQSFAPGVIERLGLAFDDVVQLKPDLIMCSISAFGRDGPLSSKPGYDGIAQAYSGVMHMNGDPDGPPALLMISPGDAVTGVQAMGMIAAALYHRLRTGEGQHIEVSLLDSYVNLHEINIQAVSGSNRALDPKRAGSHHATVCPYGVFTANDGYLLIAVVTDREWERLCAVMGCSELVADPRFENNDARARHHDDVVSLIETWLGSYSVAEACEALDAARVPAGPILSVQEAMDHPHHRGRGSIRKVTDRVWGEVDLPGLPFRLSRFPGALRLEAPFLGEHNDEVLSELGFDDAEKDDLRAAGVLRHQPAI
jgi:CoA:oxalate CoA-transferase